MKIRLLLFLIYTLVSILCCSCGNAYTVGADAVTENGEVIFTDENGNVWAWQLDADQSVFGHYTLYLADNNTPDITDDIILGWR